MAWRYPWGALFRGAAGLVFFSASIHSATAAERPARPPLRVGHGLSVVAVRKPPGSSEASKTSSTATISTPLPFPRPRLAGFSPLVAITTSSKHRTGFDESQYEHTLESTYTCQGSSGPGAFPCGALAPPANVNYIVGVADTGASADLLAGASADQLGVIGSYVTGNAVPLSGIGGNEVLGYATQPIGYYAQGLSAISPSGLLNLSALVGHSNVSLVAAPTIECGGSIAVSGLVGMPFIAFYNTVIRVDTPRRVNANGVLAYGPEVQFQNPFDPLPNFTTRIIGMTFDGLANSASWYPDVDDLDTPAIPTALSLGGFLPTGGSFFATLLLLEGDPSPFNPAITLNVLVDTGAQSSIISSTKAAELSLPFTPDFLIDACGVAGIIEDIPGYLIDYARLPALGGAMEFSQAPFIVADLPSATGGGLDGILGMNFFWNRNVILEPLSTLGFITNGNFHVSDPIPFSYGDFDLDQYVENRDTEFFTYCLTGPEPNLVTPECVHVDADENGTVDLRDYTQFLHCFSGTSTPADPMCGP